MSVLDWLIVAAVAVLLIAAVRYRWKHRGQCCGSCGSCNKSCQNRCKTENT